MSVGVFIESDASIACVAHEQRVESLSPMPPEGGGEGEREEDWRRVQRAVGAAADWMVERLGGTDRIDELTMGVAESLCQRMSAPGVSPSVVSAALRQREADWADAQIPALIQPLARERDEASTTRPKTFTGRAVEAIRGRGKSGGSGRRAGHAQAPSEKRFSVLELHDAVARLLLDELDRRGVRVGLVSTLWHAAARAWQDGADHAAGESADLRAVVLLESEGPLVWAWHDDGDLIAAGSLAIRARRQPPRRAPERLIEAERAAEGASEGRPAPPGNAFEPGAGRLTLDWLTWSAQLGRRAERIIVVGAGAEAFAEALRSRWSGAEVDAREEADAIGATMARLATTRRAGRPETDDPLRSVVELSNRPSRAHRRLGILTAAAILLIAGGLAGLGAQVQATTAAMDRARRSALVEKAVLIRDLPGAPQTARQSGFEVRALQTMLNELRAQAPEVVDPPNPRPILDELVRFASAIEPLQEAEAAQLDRLEISEDPPTAIIQASEFSLPETIRSNLTTSRGRVDWNGRIDGSPPNLILRLNGVWKEAES